MPACSPHSLLFPIYKDEEKNRTYLQQGNNIPGVPAEPSPSQGNDGAGVNEGSKSEPAFKNGAQRDAIDDQLEDFMKEIDAISSVPETDIQSGEEKNELQNEQTATTTSESVPAPETSVQEVNSIEACPPGSVNVPAATEAEVPACPWVECLDEATGYTYFWNQSTNAVTWDCPPEYEAYWAQYGEPVGAEGQDAASVTHATAPDTTSAMLMAVAAPSSATPAGTVAMSSGQTSLSSTEPITASTAEDVKGRPGTLEQNSGTTVTAGKKRKQASVIGAIIPITSYGASDSSSSEDSDQERYAVQKAQLRKHASKRPKVAARRSQKESSSPVVYGPQLPDSLLCQEEKPVFGPCLPDAPDSTQATVYGPHLPEEKLGVYGPHLPDSRELAAEPVAIGPQLPQFSEATEKVSTGVFIGPQLPDDFYEKQAKLCDEERPAVHGTCAGSETLDTSQTCMEVDIPGASLEGSDAQGSKVGEEVAHESEVSSLAAKETCVVPEPAVLGLAGLVDYPGSPVANSETEEMDVEDKPMSAASPCADPVRTPVDYPVMAGGKLQFGNVGEVLHSDEALLKGDIQSSSGVCVRSQSPLGSSVVPELAKSKRNTEAKKKSQHLVSYGDSESSDDDGGDVDVTDVGSPPAPSALLDPVSVRTEEIEDEDRHVGLGCPRRTAGEVLDIEGKKPPSVMKKQFVKVSFVRSDEVLVLGKCADMGQEVVPEKMEAEEAEKGLSPSSDRTAGTEKAVSPSKPSPDSDVDDFDDVVRALDIALLESQKKKGQERGTKHEALLQGEKRESPHDTSEEEGEIKSSEESSEAGMTPVNLRESDSEEEPEELKASTGFKKNSTSSREATSPKPDNKSAIMSEIGEAYKMLMDQLNPLRDVIACRNSYFEIVVKTMARMEDWRAGALDASYFLERLHDARAAAAELHVMVAKARDTEPDEPIQEPLPPGWQRHWDRSRGSVVFMAWAGRWAGEVLHCCGRCFAVPLLFPYGLWRSPSLFFFLSPSSCGPPLAFLISWSTLRTPSWSSVPPAVSSL
ncbi:hypothetical protein V5799_023128 [Amblyomma americanum]|uniref:WW domain-containing protein n=1 Tax=Amblyomma americanum TaxID=6943 RepID=A0AAQ4FIP5_AMBAM